MLQLLLQSLELQHHPNLLTLQLLLLLLLLLHQWLTLTFLLQQLSVASLLLPLHLERLHHHLLPLLLLLPLEEPHLLLLQLVELRLLLLLLVELHLLLLLLLPLVGLQLLLLL